MSKPLWIKESSSFNYESRYFDFYEVSQINFRLIFVQVDEAGLFKATTSTYYESLKHALGDLEHKTGYDILCDALVKRDLKEIVRTANEILNDSNKYFAIEFH